MTTVKLLALNPLWFCTLKYSSNYPSTFTHSLKRLPLMQRATGLGFRIVALEDSGDVTLLYHSASLSYHYWFIEFIIPSRFLAANDSDTDTRMADVLVVLDFTVSAWQRQQQAETKQRKIWEVRTIRICPDTTRSMAGFFGQKAGETSFSFLFL